MNKEKRIFVDKELRAVKDGDGKRFIEGYGAVFNHESRLIFDWEGEYHETIATGAFDRALASDDLDVLATVNHDNNQILGRFTAGRDNNTLALSTDDTGLKYRFEVPNTTLGNDTFESIERGDLNESSFVFRVAQEDQEWDFNSDIPTRTINTVSGLYDVSVVWKGAYSNTDVEVAQRHYTDAKAPTKEEIKKAADDIKATNDHDDMRVKLLKIKRQ